MDEAKNQGSHGEFRGFGLRACSATDCTGLIPAIPYSGAELENYEEIYRYLTKPRIPEEAD